jgi:ATP-dependent Lhr-like helicase
VYGKIWYDEKEGVFGRRGKLARVIYMLNLGTIPDEVAIDVHAGSKWIGSIEEEFLMQLKPGDVFTLGGRLYSFDHASGMHCYVTEAQASAPTIPPWFSEQLPLSFELASSIGEFRKEFAGKLSAYIKNRKFRSPRSAAMPKEIDDYLSALPIDGNAKRAIFGYFLEQLLFCGAVPTNRLMLVEETKDVASDTNYLIFHALYGRRVNDALARAFAVVLSEMFSTDIGIMVSDNGFVFSTKEEKLGVDDKLLDAVIEEIYSTGIAQMLRRNIRRTEIMKRRFRQVAARSFMILRNYKGYKITVRRQQVNSQLLLKAAEEIDPDFPVIKETYREILNDVMDLPRAQSVLEALRDKETRHKLITTPVPSPFSHNMITFGHADVIMMKERYRYLQRLHRMVMKKIRSGAAHETNG